MPRVQAALALLAVLCSGSISLLFAVRDRLLAEHLGVTAEAVAAAVDGKAVMARPPRLRWAPRTKSTWPPTAPT